MRVLLKHAEIGLYYAGHAHWVGNAESALDLETIERATEVGRDESFVEMDIVVTYDEPGCELVLPLRRKREAIAETIGSVASSPEGEESRRGLVEHATPRKD